LKNAAPNRPDETTGMWRRFQTRQNVKTKRKEKEKKSVEENSLLFETVGSRKET